MDAIPPRFDVPAEIRRDDCTRDVPYYWKADHKHDPGDERRHIDPPPLPRAPEPPFTPGRQVLDLPQRAWHEQAEQGHRAAVQIVNRRRTSVIATAP